jgi:predicted RNA-binding Zn-ribbon protein involved in translation (DUF1610 family)
MNIQDRYNEVVKKIYIKCPDCGRVFTHEDWDTKTRERFNTPKSPSIDIKPILKTFALGPAYWAWYTCPGCGVEHSSNSLRIINFNEDIEEPEL